MTNSNQVIRLDSFLSKAGIAARRKCSSLIKDGLVAVNGAVVYEPGFHVNVENDRVLFKSNPIRPVRKFYYVLLNKPKGCVCTVSDERNRPTVLELIQANKRIYPVGRLDVSTTGLLVLTDDGELSHRLSHPKYNIKKVYMAGLHKPFREEHASKFLEGIEIGEKNKVRGTVRIIGERGRKVKVSVNEGKNRMLKRMFDKLGYKVKSLDRTVYAGLTQRKLPRGGWRPLTKTEVRGLYKLVGLTNGH